MFLRLFIQTLERNATIFRKIEKELPPTPSNRRRLLSEALARIRIEQFTFHDKIAGIIRSRVLAAANPAPIIVLFLKSMGDAYIYLEPFVDATTREGRLRAARGSYQAALEAAQAKGLSSTNPQYLKTVLNWSVFQRTKFPQEDAVTPLYTAYAEAMRHFPTATDDDKPESAAVLELMRSNLASWMVDEEPAQPKRARTSSAKGRTTSRPQLVSFAEDQTAPARGGS
jgi:hypothetical protein